MGEYLLRYGRLPDDWREQVAKLQEDKAEDETDKESPVENEIDDEDIPPRQLGLWDNNESLE